MSKFMNEINKIINKKADGVKTISEQQSILGRGPNNGLRRPPSPGTEVRRMGGVQVNPDNTPKNLSDPELRQTAQNRVQSAIQLRNAMTGQNQQPAAGSAPVTPVTASGSVSRPGDSSQRPAPVSIRPTPAAAAPRPAPAAPSASEIESRYDQDDAENRASSLGNPSGKAPLPPARSAPTAAPRAAAPTTTAARSTPTTPAAAPVDPHAKSKAMFQADSDRGDDASSASFFAADKQRTAELRGMRNETFEKFVRSFVKEEGGSKEQWKGEIKKKPYTGANPKHDATSPNAQHMEEDEQLDEISGTATSFGGRHNPRRSAAKYLGGKRLQKRSSLERLGNERRRPGVYEEVKGKFMKKLSEKRSETPLGKTATNSKYSETVNTSPESPELTTST